MLWSALRNFGAPPATLELPIYVKEMLIPCFPRDRKRRCVSDSVFRRGQAARKSNVLAKLRGLSRRLGSRDFVSKQNGGSRCFLMNGTERSCAIWRRLARAIVATRIPDIARSA